VTLRFIILSFFLGPGGGWGYSRGLVQGSAGRDCDLGIMTYQPPLQLCLSPLLWRIGWLRAQGRCNSPCRSAAFLIQAADGGICVPLPGGPVPRYGASQWLQHPRPGYLSTRICRSRDPMEAERE
jgi:hypothetical protein